MHYFALIITLQCTYARIDDTGRFYNFETLPHCAKTRRISYQYVHDLKSELRHLAEYFELLKEKMELSGSGWVFQFVHSLDFKIIKTCMVGGKGRNMTIPLARDQYLDYSDPSETDCFYTAVATGMYHHRSRNSRAMSREAIESVVKQIKRDIVKPKHSQPSAPFHIKNITRVEKANVVKKLAVNVFGSSGASDFHPIHISKADKSFKRINLFFHAPSKMRRNKEFVGHFVFLPDLHEVVTRYRRKNSNNRPGFVCESCLHVVTNKAALEQHLEVCRNENSQRIKYPSAHDCLSFDPASHRQHKVDYIGFLDFEAKNETQSNYDNYKSFNCENCGVGGPVRHCSHSERIISKQTPMTYSFYIFSSQGQIALERTYSSDENLMKDFFQTLSTFGDELMQRVQKYKRLHWSQRLEQIFIAETKCYICKTGFLPGHKTLSKVRDHCHATPPVKNVESGILESKYMGAAHIKCNLRRQAQHKIPVFVHNFMSYDANFLLKELQCINGQKLKGIPYNNNKLRTLQLGAFSFQDSYQMLAGSLAELADDLAKSECAFNLLRQGQLAKTEEAHQLLLRKSVYPYEWVHSVEQLTQTTSLPPREEFFSHLKNDTISEVDFAHGQNVFRTLGCRNMLEYTELYCKLDTLLLAEIVYSFRDLIFDEFGLAVEHYISTPQLAFDACLKIINEPIEIMHDPTMIQKIEKNIRGGVSFVNNRWEKSDDGGEIIYVDANNLYGMAQMCPMPFGGYRYLSETSYSQISWSSQKLEQATGYIVEADLEIPPHVHGMLDNLPIAPTQSNISYKHMSPTRRECTKI